MKEKITKSKLSILIRKMHDIKFETAVAQKRALHAMSLAHPELPRYIISIEEMKKIFLDYVVQELQVTNKRWWQL